jgi:hypothetical protein
MHAMNALGRRTLNLQNTWAACGAGITGTAAALFVAREGRQAGRSRPVPVNFGTDAEPEILNLVGLSEDYLGLQYTY